MGKSEQPFDFPFARFCSSWQSYNPACNYKAIHHICIVSAASFQSRLSTFSSALGIKKIFLGDYLNTLLHPNKDNEKQSLKVKKEAPL